MFDRLAGWVYDETREPMSLQGLSGEAEQENGRDTKPHTRNVHPGLSVGKPSFFWSVLTVSAGNIATVFSV